MNNRRDFLKLTGLAGAAALVPIGSLSAAAKKSESSQSCVLIPNETAGPYPLDLSKNSAIFRQDIRESQAGLQLNLRLKFVGVDNCLPIPNARIDVWHCNANGNYSGYTTNGHSGGSQNFAGQTWLRGIQMTDANGEVEFVTIVPIWYSGRVVHIHFQVYLSSVLQATSQLTFPVATANHIFTTVAPYSQYGADPSSLSSDNVFSDGYALQMATLTPNATTGGYDSYLEVGVKGAGTSGLRNVEPETGGQFKLGQNFPNPYKNRTTIPFTLANTSDVTVEIWDLSGIKVGEVRKNELSAGEQNVLVDLGSLGLPNGNYVYQLRVVNQIGEFVQCRMMTSAK
ncbi:MAG: hypothetical protein JWQ98_1171 [Chlorobi bacterium]|nr:hypothetical protein [Chlorobiota bacterium]